MSLRNSFLAAVGAISLAGCAHQIDAYHTDAIIPATKAKVAQSLQTPFQISGPASQSPFGYTKFCHEFPGKIMCTSTSQPVASVVSFTEWENKLFEGNMLINSAIIPRLDVDTYGVDEKWVSLLKDLRSEKNVYGDCEDYVLTKMDYFFYHMNLPKKAMHIAALIDENNTYHAVLLITTDKGFVMLDNKTDTLTIFSSREELYKNIRNYTFVAISTDESPTQWIDISQDAVQKSKS